MSEVRLPAGVQTIPEYLQGLNAAQLEATAAASTQGLRVMAGAGTGKTRVITTRFLHLASELLAQGVVVPQQHLLVLTFTEKAAGEMRERIHQGLQRHLQPMRQADEAALSSAEDWITTFHSFCNRLLRKHPLEAALSESVSPMDAATQEGLWQSIIQQVHAGHCPHLEAALRQVGLQEDLPADYFTLPSLQTLGLQNLSELLPLLPGIIHQVKASGWSPKEFLDNTLAQIQRFDRQIRSVPTVHPQTGEPFMEMQSVCWEWASHWKDWADACWLQHCYEEAENNEAYREKVKPLWKSKWYLGSTLKKNARLTLDEPTLNAWTQAECHLTRLTAALYALYQYTLQQQNRCDFNDLINRTIEMLDAYPEIRAQYQGQFHAILVDEFQDTDGSQLRLLRLLQRSQPQEEAQPPQTTSNVTVVGDIKQSIYGFRFAQPENLTLMFDRKCPPNTVALQANYRCQPPVVAFANVLADRITAEDPAQRLHVGRPLCEHSPGSVHWVTLGQEEATLGQGTEKKPPEPIAALRVRERQFIAAEAARLVADEGVMPGDIAVLVETHAQAYAMEQSLRQMGLPVIRPKNPGFFREPVIMDAMALLRLLVNPEDDLSMVRLLQGRLSALQLVALNQLRKRVSLARRLQDQAAETLPHRASYWQLLQQLPGLLAQPKSGQAIPGVDHALELECLRWLERIPPEVQQALVHFQQSFSVLLAQRKKQGDWVRLFHQAANTLGLILPDASPTEAVQQRLQLQVLEALMTRALQENRAALQGRANHWALNGEMVAGEWLLGALTELAQEKDLTLPLPPGLGERQAVQVLTFHAAKGLEFPVVFVSWVGRAKQAAPSSRAPVVFDPQYPGKPGFGLMLGRVNGRKNWKKDWYRHIWKKPQEEAERLRLFYVAVTRARDRLYVTRSVQSAEWTLVPSIEGLLREYALPPNALVHWQESDAQCPLHTQYASADRGRWRQQVQARLQTAESSLATTTVAVEARQAEPCLPDREQAPFGAGMEALLLEGHSVALAQKMTVHVSVSALQRYQECPVWYYWRDVLHLPEPPPVLSTTVCAAEAQSPPSPLPETQTAALRGEWVHRLIQQHYRQHGYGQHGGQQQPGQQHSNGLLADSAMNDLLRFAGLSAEEDALVRALYRQFEQSAYAWPALLQQGYRQVWTEQPIRFHLNPLLSRYGFSFEPAQAVVLRGKMDALAFNPATETTLLLDFKTTQSAAPPSQARQQAYFQQLWFYQQALNVSLPQYSREIPNEQVRLIVCGPQQVWESSLADWAIDGQQTLLSVVPALVQDLLRQPDALPLRSEHAHCNRCAYRAVCPQSTAT
ncbi:MAG: UvrD-helicase domain-containing protein [Candidatus Melainabacteria bacterium]|nr:UvrD-helicase domain-containing protein [Candidatus Melainabacteria bacterium]